MIISHSQFSKLAEPLDAAFVDKLTQMLVDHQERQPNDQFCIDVKRMVEKARQFGMSTERDAAGFVVAAFLLGENFDREFPAARSVLQSTSLPGVDKAVWLANWTTMMFQILEEDEK